MASQPAKVIRDYTKKLKPIGVGVVGIVSINKHIKLRIAFGEHETNMTVPLSGSDLRGDKNFIADVRRWVRSLDSTGE